VVIMNENDIMKLAYEGLNTPIVSTAPKMVPGRVLHADADIFSYKACNLEETYAENVSNLKELITAWRVLAGAEFIVLHLTMGRKGGREQIAQVKKYQGNRSKTNEDKSQRVLDLRMWMAEFSNINVRSDPQYEQEADDSMCQAMYRSIQFGQDDVLFSPDKDLWMVPGKHLNKDTFEIEEFPLGYGETGTVLDSNGKKKVVGKGTSWFWHQLLMGDSADNIPGLPFLSKSLVLEYCPNKAMADIQKRVATGRMPNGKVLTAAQKRAAQTKYERMFQEQDAKKIGGVLATRYLQTCKTDKSAYQYVLNAYKSWYRPKAIFFNWEHVRMECTPYEMMLEQARLLWMRRTVNEDVEEWFEELRHG